MTGHEDTRPPIDPAIATAALAEEGRWRIEVVEEVASTNAAVAERFREGESGGLVLAAEHQNAGRGRLGREWVAPPGSSLTVSFLLVPQDAPAERWPWLSLLAGIAAARAVRRVTGAEVGLKWPNDVLVDDHKAGGILLERVEGPSGPAAVVGIGLNCSQTREELPVPGATSLTLVTGEEIDRALLLAALCDALGTTYDRWLAGEDLRAAYLELCTTPGQPVRVAVPDGEVVGEAVDVDAAGRLVVRTDSGEEHLGAGDVVHVRGMA